MTITGTELKVEREAMQLTQAELGAELGVSRNTINRWEMGRMEIDQPRMLILALQSLRRLRTK